MKCKKNCKFCNQQKGQDHLIGCPVEENSQCKMPDIKDVKPIFIN